jgi:hypothetical protein
VILLYYNLDNGQSQRKQSYRFFSVLTNQQMQYWGVCVDPIYRPYHTKLGFCWLSDNALGNVNTK